MLDTRELKYEESLELTRMADVLLQPSKTEGFGMPVLEAQLLGTPVITTGFGGLLRPHESGTPCSSHRVEMDQSAPLAAMKDFTMYGVSVPPLQPHYMGLGYAVMPNLTGIVAALHTVADGSLTGADRKRAAQFVRNKMNRKSVGAAFERLFTLVKPEQDYARLQYGGMPPSSKPKGSEWSVVASSTQAVDHAAISYGVARAKAASPPQCVLLFQTAELDGTISPSKHDLAKGSMAQQPVLAACTPTLKEALKTTGGNLDLAVQVLLGNQQQEGGSGSGVAGLVGGVGAARIYYDPKQADVLGRAGVTAGGVVTKQV